jgi:hypothetical protein
VDAINCNASAHPAIANFDVVDGFSGNGLAIAAFSPAGQFFPDVRSADSR